eukprot:GSChrysophyteH1.ASY1.ANO1.1740.1 assembled CDS
MNEWGTKLGVFVTLVGLYKSNFIRVFKDCHGWSICSFFIITIGYFIQSSALEFFFYYRRASSRSEWKIQPNVGNIFRRIHGPPMFGREKNGRHRLHRLFCSINILQAGSFAFITAELSLRGMNHMYFEFHRSCDILVVLAIMASELLAAIIWQSFLEYWWHILMHQPIVYKTMHKYHHHYKAPEPFDDLFIHPVESFGYYCILYSIPFVIPVHVSSMVIYMIVMGLAGVMDHSGIEFNLRVPWCGTIYSSVDHDVHHQLFDYNYAFPFPFLDKFHGTYKQSPLLKS